jgi:hypothetical protein
LEFSACIGQRLLVNSSRLRAFTVEISSSCRHGGELCAGDFERSIDPAASTTAMENGPSHFGALAHAHHSGMFRSLDLFFLKQSPIARSSFHRRRSPSC